MNEPKWRIEAHIWFKNFDEYLLRKKELSELLERLHGDSSVIVFFRKTPEYLEIPGACYDHMDDKQTDELINFCGKNNVDFVARVSRNTERELGCLRGKQRQDE